jgi:hypothetical protein
MSCADSGGPSRGGVGLWGAEEGRLVVPPEAVLRPAAARYPAMPRAIKTPSALSDL